MTSEISYAGLLKDLNKPKREKSALFNFTIWNNNLNCSNNINILIRFKAIKGTNQVNCRSFFVRHTVLYNY